MARANSCLGCGHSLFIADDFSPLANDSLLRLSTESAPHPLKPLSGSYLLPPDRPSPSQTCSPSALDHSQNLLRQSLRRATDGPRSEELSQHLRAMNFFREIHLLHQLLMQSPPSREESASSPLFQIASSSVQSGQAAQEAHEGATRTNDPLQLNDKQEIS